jgi:hypothetical protein
MTMVIKARPVSCKAQSIGYCIPANKILQEAKKLHEVSGSLKVFLKQHAPISEVFFIPPGSARKEVAPLKCSMF